MKLIAVHEIVRGPVSKRETVKANTPFTAETEEAEYLLKVGAARKASGNTEETDVEKAPLQSNSTDVTDVELANMTKAQLVQFAKDHEIEIDTGDTKAEVLDTIEAALTAGDDLV